MATLTADKVQTPKTDEELAAQFAGGLIYGAILEAGEPAKVTDLARLSGHPDMDTRLARVIAVTNSHITPIDRKWTLWTRYLDNRRTFDFNLQRTFNTYGHPIRIPQLAREMHSIFGRPAEIYEEVLERLAQDSPAYFFVAEDYVAPSAWLLDTEQEADDEVLYENFLRDEEALPFIEAAEQADLKMGDPASVIDFLDRIDAPILNKALQFLAWRRDKEKFDAREFYTMVFTLAEVQPMLGGSWIGPKTANRLTLLFPVLAQQEVSDTIEATAQETAQPIVFGDVERETLVARILEHGGLNRASNLLEDIFEVTPDYRTYAEDMSNMIRLLSTDDRVIWLGSDRFRPIDNVPGYVYTVPGLLEIPETDFTDMEGNPLDQLLQDEGFDGGLERDILSPFAQDVLDEELVASPDPNPPSNARAVVKYHHKQIGTLPLCQFASGFFPAEPTILEADFVLPSGQKTQVWINNQTRLMYGLLDWFETIPIDSGATFTLERQDVDRYVVNYNDESEPSMFISRSRVNELLALQERADAEELATYDIVREIMEHYRKGIEFLTLHTEVNIVRRATRRMVASILSGYYCFFQRGGAWVYDAKKLNQGFEKSKRKYLVK